MKRSNTPSPRSGPANLGHGGGHPGWGGGSTQGNKSALTGVSRKCSPRSSLSCVLVHRDMG